MTSVAVPAEVRDLHRRNGMAYFDTWVAAAQPGARVRYGIGYHVQMACAAGVATRMRALSEAGLVTLHLNRARPCDANYPINFLAVRTGKPVPKGFPVLPMTHDQRLASAVEGKA